MKIATREQRRDGVRFSQRTNVCAVDFFQMVTACCAKLNAESRGAGVRELLRMDARAKSERLSRGQYPPRLSDRERTAFAKHITKFSQSGARNFGQHPIGNKRRVSLGAVGLALVFGRHHVRAKKS